MIRRINRFELKYVVDAFRVKAFLKDLAPFVRPDPHADASGFYRVVSLYYDSPQFHCYRAKIEGLKFRRKLRLRIYPAGDLKGVREGMVEIKQRIDRTVQKRRLKLDLATAEGLCAGEAAPPDLDGLDRATALEVRTLVSALQLRPAVVISYVRRPFVGSRYDPGLRVTVDSSVSARIHGLKVDERARNHLFLPQSLCVLEVKVNERIPRWLASLLASHNFSIRRLSKYCEGLARAYRLGFRSLE